MTRRLIGTVLAVVSLMIGFVGGATVAIAQEASPESEVAHSHPAHIHSGTCDELGDVVYPLENVDGEILEGTPEATPAPTGEGRDGAVLGQSQSTVDATLDDLLAEEHAVNVHESEENIGNFIACANIEGEPDAEGSLILDLMELNDSGYAGQVVLTEVEDGTTTVTLTLSGAQVEGEQGAATPDA